ncbi:hypothetical protein AGMMS49991_01100 [Spirochaetia bacterium]|nr:hypothetical protein AGMMS49991_01100 [Spirochaetia bacterium]
MDKHELLSRITTFQLASRDLAEDLLAGEFLSVFKGQGMEFDEVRHYEIGDDVRSIDWNVSARFGTPYVKLYREERELSVCIVLDLSASMHTGGGAVLTSYEQGLLAAALIAFSAERSGQRVGAVFFDRDISQVFSPRKGRAHIMTLLSAALGAPEPTETGGQTSDLGKALAGTGRLLKARRFRRSGPRSLVVLISDFMCVNWEQPLGDLCAEHDVIALRITGPLDREIPNAGLITLQDTETGLLLHAPSGSAAFRASWAEWHEERSQFWQIVCRRRGAAALSLSTDDDAVTVLTRFFRGRRRRR